MVSRVGSGGGGDITIKNICQRMFELKRFDREAFRMMTSFCSNAELGQTPLHSKFLNNAYHALDGDFNDKISLKSDSFQLLKNVDANVDDRINRVEFLAHFEQHLYNLVLEDVFTQGFKKPNTRKESVLDKLFPYENSTIGEKEIKDLLSKFDLNGDEFVTRNELNQVFQTNRDLIVKYFEERIEKVEKKLILQTNQPMEVR